MFFHNFKYSLKVLLKNKTLLFWTFIFPIVLGIFFHMAFSNIESSEMLDVIPMAIVDNDVFQNNFVYQEAFLGLSDERNERRLFDLQITSLDIAKRLLEEDKIKGYVHFLSDGAVVTVNQSGIDETILQYVVDEVESNGEMIHTLLQERGLMGNTDENLEWLEFERAIQSSYEGEDFDMKIASLLAGREARLKDISNEHLSYTMIEYYTLIAMACLYGGILSMFLVNYLLPNMKSVGKRVAVSSLGKGKMILSSLLASYLVQLLGVILLFLFTIFGLGVDYGERLGWILLLAALGSLAGLSLGVMIGTLVKKNENTKMGILIGVTMVGSFLSGMMGITMKYVIDKNIPLMNRINPASMITDGLYALYSYETLSRYFVDIGSLILFSVVMILLSLQGLRRQKYDSI